MEIEPWIQRANNEGWNWDDCRHHARQVPLTPERFWLRIKLSRLSARQPIPLQDTNGEAFSYRQPSEVLRLLRLVDLHLGGNLASASPLLPNTNDRERFLIRSLMEEAINSSLIEGAAVTREVAREMLRSNRTPRSADERMILNNFQTILMLKHRKDEPMSLELLLDIQRQLTVDTLNKPDAVGRLRAADEKIAVYDGEDELLHDPPPARQLPARMQKLCEFANAPETSAPFVHPVIRAIILHFWIGYDHPFYDGNGRTARGLFYWSMLRSGYWMAEYFSISPIIRQQVVQYGKAFLNAEIDDNDVTYFILHQLRVLEAAIDEVNRYVAEKSKEKVRLLSLQALRAFNERQVAILQRALKDPTTRFSYESHARSHNITLATARSDLLDLEAQGLLLGNRHGRRFVFTAAPDLEEKLRQRK